MSDAYAAALTRVERFKTLQNQLKTATMKRAGLLRKPIDAHAKTQLNALDAEIQVLNNEISEMIKTLMETLQTETQKLNETINSMSKSQPQLQYGIGG